MAAHGTRRYPPLVDVINPSTLLPFPALHVFPPPRSPPIPSRTRPLAPPLRSSPPNPPPFPFFSPLSSPSPPVPCSPCNCFRPRALLRLRRRRFSRRKIAHSQLPMDRKNANGSPPFTPSAAPTSEPHGAKGSSSSSSPSRNHSSSGIFNSVFPPATPLEGRNSPKSDIFGPSRKPENANPSWNGTHTTSEGGKYGYNPDKEHTVIGKDEISIYQNERSGPCSLSNSLYYGGQDICVQSPKTSYTDKNDDEDDPASSHFASRGNWWQGSLYY